LHVLRILKTSKRPSFDIPALDSIQSPQAVDIREEICVALNRAGSTAATKKATRGNEVRRGHNVTR
jgi:hypothetical protein